MSYPFFFLLTLPILPFFILFKKQKQEHKGKGGGWGLGEPNNSLDEIIKIVIKKHIFERFMYFLCDFRVISPATCMGPQTPKHPPEHNGVINNYQKYILLPVSNNPTPIFVGYSYYHNIHI